MVAAVIHWAQKKKKGPLISLTCVQKKNMGFKFFEKDGGFVHSDMLDQKRPSPSFGWTPMRSGRRTRKKSRGHFGHFTHKLASGGSQSAPNLIKMGKIGHFWENGFCVHPWSPKCRKKVVFWSHGILLAKICPQLNLSGRWGPGCCFWIEKSLIFSVFGAKTTCAKTGHSRPKRPKITWFFFRDGRP